MFKASDFYEKDNPRAALRMEIQQEAQKAEAEESLKGLFLFKRKTPAKKKEFYEQYF